MDPSPRIISRATQTALASILVLSGFCSLVYQTVWLREFRLVFGGAAPAAAAVMAVFMAGLGFGGKVFGEWVDRVARPLRFYARLEVGISLAALASPVMLALARMLYLKTGGTVGMGLTAATCLQLLMTALVLGVPCFLMGGTLPAVMKYAQRDDDPRRSATAFFYGINIAGAVAGAALSTFWLLPNLGNTGTLTLAVVVNLVIALAAGVISHVQEKNGEDAVSEPVEIERVAAKAPVPFVLAAAFMSGFTFFVIELIWYRISTPLLGGSVYGFGLVLCVVLAGMGIGGLLYALILKKAEPSISGFTVVSALQALAVLIPFALGDAVAHLALILNNSLRGLGLAELAMGWVVIMSLLAFLPSVLSGIQFPMLVSLLGRGNSGVGRQLGHAYLWNTFGSISGSLMGGFFLVPALGMTRCWVVVALLIAGMSVVALWIQFRQSVDQGGARWQVLTQSRTALAALVACGFCAFSAVGPTAVWQHTPIGYGRVRDDVGTALGLETWQRSVRRNLVAAYDGRETSVAVVGGAQYAFLTNGKSDGSAVDDGATQVMLGIVGAILHPNPQKACVVGLGTGTTAGWLADVPGIQRVDVLELEEEIRKVAEFFDPVSRNAMHHPRVNNITGDAREFLLTKGENYDLIVSEPSNPCRAGVANLYTREFYENASQRLNEDGLFCQWLQGYEVEPETITTVISTLHQVFPKVEVWATQTVDMLLVCSKEDVPWELDSLRRRIQLDPMKEALNRFWQTETAEGFLAGCVANSDYCAALAREGEGRVNTDDMNRLEFNFARSVAKKANCSYDLMKAATQAGCQLPKIDAALDSALYLAERVHVPGRLWKSATADALAQESPELFHERVGSLKLFWKRQYEDYLAAPAPVVAVLADRLLLALAKARLGASDAEVAIAAIEKYWPVDAAFLRVIAARANRRSDQVLTHLSAGLKALRQSPWCRTELVVEGLSALPNLARDSRFHRDPRFLAVFDDLAAEYPVAVAQASRMGTRCEMALHLPVPAQLRAVETMGYPYPWDGRALVLRANAYLNAKHQETAMALAEMNRYLEQGGKIGGESPPFVVNVVRAGADAAPIVIGAKP